MHFTRSFIKEVDGFAPYKKSITELLKVEKAKCALKIAKRKLGTDEREKKEERRWLAHSGYEHRVFFS